MITNISYTTNELPQDIKKQLLVLYKHFFPSGFTGKNEGRDWLDKFTIPVMRFLILDDNKVVSHVAVITKFIEHDGVKYKLAGIGGVMTDELYQGKGYGTQLVKAATDYIDSKDFDIAILFCDPKRHNFYGRNGWKLLINQNITVGEYGVNVYPQKESTMIRYLSDKARNNEEAFTQKPLFLGNEW